jgi:hypothetical protein
MALLWQQGLEQVADFRFVQRPDVMAQGQRVAIGDRRADMGEERRADDAGFVVDRRSGIVALCARITTGALIVFRRQVMRLVQDRLPCRLDSALLRPLVQLRFRPLIRFGDGIKTIRKGSRLPGCCSRFPLQGTRLDARGCAPVPAY